MDVGIDFGTCFSSIAFMSGNQPLAALVGGPEGIPSLFMHSRSQGDLYGDRCMCNEASEHPEHVVRYMKKTLRQTPGSLESTITSGGKTFRLEEIVRSYINYLLDTAVQAAKDYGELENTNIENITVTVPVGIEDGHMLATDYRETIRSIVMDSTHLTKAHVHILEEPVAAAIHYLNSDIGAPNAGSKKILVYDLGGGTLDVTVVSHDARNGYKVICTEGDLNIGGINWDDALAQIIMRKHQITRFNDAYEHALFRECVVKTKLSLTNSVKCAYMFTYEGDDILGSVTRDEFENATKGLLNSSMEVVKKCLNRYGSSIGTLDNVILVGGSCNMPQIKKGFINAFSSYNEDKVFLFDPSKAIAKGAALYSKEVKTGVISIARGASQTYGFLSHNNEQNNKEMIYNLIYKDTQFGNNREIAKRAPITFSPMSDNQAAVEFSVYESDTKYDANDHNWAEIKGSRPGNLSVVIDVPAEYKGTATQWSMWPEIILDQDGVVTIRITDLNGRELAKKRRE